MLLNPTHNFPLSTSYPSWTNFQSYLFITNVSEQADGEYNTENLQRKKFRLRIDYTGNKYEIKKSQSEKFKVAVSHCRSEVVNDIPQAIKGKFKSFLIKFKNKIEEIDHVLGAQENVCFYRGDLSLTPSSSLFSRGQMLYKRRTSFLSRFFTN